MWAVASVASVAWMGCNPVRPGARTAGAATRMPVEASACVVAGEAMSRIAVARADATQAEFCVETGETQHCYSVQLATGRLREVSTAPAPQAASLLTPAATIATKAKRVEVCMIGGACVELKYKFGKTPPTQLAINAEGTLAAIAVGDAAAGKASLEIWDVRANRKLGATKYARGEYRCGVPWLLDETLWVSAANCEAPSARGVLFSKNGKRLADVGNADFGTFGSAHTQLTDKLWAFLEETALAVVIQDVTTGRVEKTLDLAELWRHDTGGGASDTAGQATGQPGESALVRNRPNSLVVISGGPAPGSVAVIDVAAGSRKVWRAKTCGHSVAP